MKEYDVVVEGGGERGDAPPAQTSSHGAATAATAGGGRGWKMVSRCRVVVVEEGRSILRDGSTRVVEKGLLGESIADDDEGGRGGDA